MSDSSRTVTFSTCWYEFKAKFDKSIYYRWIDNMLANVRNYNLVIYSDEKSSVCLQPYLTNPRIKLVLKPFEQFFNYRYAKLWEKNHEKNYELNQKVDWRVNMLWAEKVHFVFETMVGEYFESEYYGWCDIGYFRGRQNDLPTNLIRTWPNPEKIAHLHPSKIYYACINNDSPYINKLFERVVQKNDLGLPSIPLPPNQQSIAGGFFITHGDNVEWWRRTFDEKLSLYFTHDYLVKDDQMVIADCIFSNMRAFSLCREDNSLFDNWFLFQRFLL